MHMAGPGRARAKRRMPGPDLGVSSGQRHAIRHDRHLIVNQARESENFPLP
jgi:hypothetical protein